MHDVERLAIYDKVANIMLRLVYLIQIRQLFEIVLRLFWFNVLWMTLMRNFVDIRLEWWLRLLDVEVQLA